MPQVLHHVVHVVQLRGPLVAVVHQQDRGREKTFPSAVHGPQHCAGDEFRHRPIHDIQAGIVARVGFTVVAGQWRMSANARVRDCTRWAKISQGSIISSIIDGYSEYQNPIISDMHREFKRYCAIARPGGRLPEQLIASPSDEHQDPPAGAVWARYRGSPETVGGGRDAKLDGTRSGASTSHRTHRISP